MRWKVPRAIIYDGIRVIAADDDSVRAFDVESGKELWNVAAAEPET